MPGRQATASATCRRDPGCMSSAPSRMGATGYAEQMSESTPSHARIDLHAHSTWSDGTCDVGELFARAADAGLDVLALTDHDTVAGWGDLPDAVAASGVAAVPGIEVSAERDRLSVHILALLPDPGEHTELAAVLRRARASRDGRARVMVERISADHPITWEDVLEQVGGDATVIGRPHIADALVRAGVITHRGEAFAHILHPDGPYYERYWAPEPAAAIHAIRAAGGAAIAAHPASGMRDGALPVALLEEMIAAGLAGIEVDHREHDPETRTRLRALARAHDLIITGGSDYHGAGKPNELGENLAQPMALDAIRARITSTAEVISP